jgi:hypothetical protein
MERRLLRDTAQEEASDGREKGTDDAAHGDQPT